MAENAYCRPKIIIIIIIRSIQSINQSTFVKRHKSWGESEARIAVVAAAVSSYIAFHQK